MKIINHESGLMDIDEAAAFLGLKKSSLYQLTFKRQIPFVKLGRRIRFTIDQLQNFISKNTVEAGNFES